MLNLAAQTQTDGRTISSTVSWRTPTFSVINLVLNGTQDTITICPSVREYYDVTLRLNFDLVDIMILYHPIRRLCEMLSQAVYELLSYGQKHVRSRGHSDLWPVFGLLWFLRYCVHKNGRDRQTAGWREGTTRIHNCSHQAAASVEA